MVTHTLRRRRDRGAAAVEFALVMPILVVLLLGIAEFGNLFFIQAQVAGAARVAIRTVALAGTQAAETTAIQNLPVQGATLVSGVFTYTDATGASKPGPCAAGLQAKLVLKYQYHSLTGLFDSLLGSNVVVTGKGSMACGG